MEFFFRGSDEKIPVQKSFRGGFGAVFLSRWDFFPDTFPVSFWRRNPPTGFSDSRTSAPGVSRVPSKGQVLRGFHDILIPAWRVWLRFLRAVPTRRPNTRFSEGENEQIVNGPRMCHSVNGRRCAGGAHSLSHRHPDNAPFQGNIAITADFGTLSLWQPQNLAIRSQHNPPPHIFMHNAAHLLRITFDLFFSFSYLITTCLHHPIFTY